MAAIEYGSYYWGVVLNGKDAKEPAESVYLHADDLAMRLARTLLLLVRYGKEDQLREFSRRCRKKRWRSWSAQRAAGQFLHEQV